jgi:hypothetical protein
VDDIKKQRYLPAAPSRARIKIRTISKGYSGTHKTLQHIQALIRAGAKDFYVRQKAIDILLQRGVQPKDYLGEIQALFEWVQQNVRYTKDPYRVEVLHSARRLLDLLAGDCDDMTILLAAMLESVGHPTRMVIVGPNRLQPSLFSHIYLEVSYQGRWIPLDPTMPFSMGWAPKAQVKKVISIDRRNQKMSEDKELYGAENAVRDVDWLNRLVRDVGAQGLQPRDPRIKRLYELLRKRQLRDNNPGIQRLLREVWQGGLKASPSPHLQRYLTQQLINWGLLTAESIPAHSEQTNQQAARRPFKRIRLRPVQVRPVQVRPVQPVKVTAVPMDPAQP